MVIDCILYNGEEDLFDLRYNVLKDHVDLFVVLEATETFSGKPKKLMFPKEKYPDVRYYVVDDYPNDKELSDLAWSSPSVPAGQTHWHREFYQRESLKKALTDLKDDDIVFVSDCDEIWQPNQMYPDNGGKLKLRVYSYYLDNRSNEEFWGTFVAKYKYIKDGCINHFRTNPPLKSNTHLGWHFTNIGGLDKIKFKIESYGHQEFNTPEIKGALEERMKKRVDYIGRNFTYTLDESDWPQYLKDNRNKYQHLCFSQKKS